MHCLFGDLDLDRIAISKPKLITQLYRACDFDDSSRFSLSIGFVGSQDDAFVSEYYTMHNVDRYCPAVFGRFQPCSTFGKGVRFV